MCASVCKCRGQGTVSGSWSFPFPTGIQRSLQLCGKCHYFSAPLPASDWKRDFIALGRLRLTVETWLLLNLWMFLLLLPPEHWGLGALFFFFFFLERVSLGVLTPKGNVGRREEGVEMMQIQCAHV